MPTADLQPTLPPDVAARLDEAVRRIVEIAGPQLVILFGSYAEGTANEDSDIDLLVVAETERLIATEVQLSRALREVFGPLAFDLVVHTPDWWEKARRVRGFVAREADRKGVRLYEPAPIAGPAFTISSRPPTPPPARTRL